MNWKRLKQLTEAGKKGGKNRAKQLSPERRKEIARLGGLAKSLKYANQSSKEVSIN